MFQLRIIYGKLETTKGIPLHRVIKWSTKRFGADSHVVQTLRQVAISIALEQPQSWESQVLVMDDHRDVIRMLKLLSKEGTDRPVNVVFS